MTFALPTVLLWLLTMPFNQPNCWRGLTPLRSTCDDVKKVLSIVECSKPITNYTSPELEVMITEGLESLERYGDFHNLVSANSDDA